MDNAAQYSERPKLDGDKTEMFRVYYDRSQISFELFLWLESAAQMDLIKSEYKIFKAYSFFADPPAAIVCKN